MSTVEPPVRQAPVGLAANLLAVVAGAFLLCSPLTLVEGFGGLIGEGDQYSDGTQLIDRDRLLIGVIWPTVALALAIVAGIRRSNVAVGTGLGVLMPTSSYGLALLTSSFDQHGVALPPADSALRPAALLVGVLAVAAVGVTTWWLVAVTRDRASVPGSTWVRRFGAAAFIASFVASVVTAVDLARDFDIPILPALVASVIVLVAAAAMVTGGRPNVALAAAVAVASLAETFDTVVIRGIPLSFVASDNADRLRLVGLVVALAAAAVASVPPRGAFASSARSLRSRLVLADEWDD